MDTEDEGNWQALSDVALAVLGGLAARRREEKAAGASGDAQAPRRSAAGAEVDASLDARRKETARKLKRDTGPPDPAFTQRPRAIRCEQRGGHKNPQRMGEKR